MRTTPLLLVLGAATVVVAGAVAAFRDAGPAAATEPPPGPPDSGEPRAARPPQFPAVAGEQDRVLHWVATMQTGAEDDVAWAVSRLRLAGAQGRRAVRDAAYVAVESNGAFVDQALVFLSTSPEDDDVPFAVAALASSNPQAVVRAIRLLGRTPGPRRDDTARAIAAAAAEADRTLRVEALTALAKIGGDAAADAALRLVGAAPVADAPEAIRALTGFRHEKVHAALAAAFPSEQSLPLRFAAAEALVRDADPAPVAWLESLVASPPRDPLDYADMAVAVLAQARHAGALARIGATLSDSLAGTPARLAALRRLEPYPLESKRELLEAAASPAQGNDDELRLEALRALVRAEAPGIAARLATMAAEGDAREATTAALVAGSARRPDLGPAMLRALERTDQDADTRAYELRAVVLSGAPASAERIARAIASDHGTGEDEASPAFNAAAMLSEATPAFRAALAPYLVRALNGEFGALSGQGLVQALRAAGLICGPEASAAVAGLLAHADLRVRSNAALALGFVAGPDTERDLRAAWWRAGPDERSGLEKAMERAHYGAVSERR